MVLATFSIGEDPGLRPSDLIGISPNRNKRLANGSKRRSSRSAHSNRLRRKLKTVLLSAVALVSTYSGEKTLDWMTDIYRDWAGSKEPAIEKRVEPKNPIEHHIIYIPIGPNNKMFPLNYEEMLKCQHITTQKRNCYVFTHNAPVGHTAPSSTHQKCE